MLQGTGGPTSAFLASSNTCTCINLDDKSGEAVNDVAVKQIVII